MNKNLTIFLFFISTSLTFSQVIVDEIENSQSLIEAYISPLGKSIGQGLNNGWFNTAKPHRLGGFDLTFNFNIVSVPSPLLKFDPNELEGFSSESLSPSILGEGEGATITYTHSSGLSEEFKMPDQALQLNQLPVPTLNLGVGLLKETELNVRYIPSTTYDIEVLGQGSVSLMGIGFKHNLMQWIPLGSKLPIDLSIQAAYTNLNTSFEIKSDNIDQMIELNTTAYNYNLILSKKLLMFTPYLSVGYNQSVTNFNSNTNFKLGDGINAINFNIPYEVNFTDLDILNYSAGIRVQIALLSLHISQSFSDYKTTSIGAGISFR
jgi:hypothetical protein